MKKREQVNGENIVYHIIQKQIIQAYDATEPPREVKFMIEKLLLWGGVWFKPKTYQQIPVLLPYAVRDAACRKKDPTTGEDTRGVANNRGFMPDDNSSIKGIPRTLTIEGVFSEMNGNTLGNGYVASHCWRILQNKPDLLASQWERTNSFIPNLVWLPTQLSKLTDREGSYAQRFIQHVSGLLYRNIDLQNPMLAEIWDELKDPDITPVCEVNLDQLNYFEDNEKWLSRRKDNLLKELQSILNILDGGSPIVKTINVSKYVPSLIDIAKKLSPSDKAYLKKWIRANMGEDLILDDYWKDQLAVVYEHIKRDCAPGDYDWNRRGIIVADDETGELLALVKEALKYDELDAAGKVNEIAINKSWPLNSFDKCWEMLLAEARRVNHGLLVVNVNDIRIFDHCWCIKQLAKQEDPSLKFNEYVLLVIKDIPWAQVKEYANEHDTGEFNAMMDCFYHRVYFEG